MKGLKKVLSIILAIMMVVSIVPITANATTSGTCGDNLTWTYSSGTLTISGAGSMDDYSSSNRPWESYEDNIKKVVINNSVTTIGTYAFNDCDSLTDVTLGDNITSIGCAAFRYCYNLTSINIPNSVTTINDNVFFSCIRLERVTIPACLVTIGSGAFRYCDSLTSITVNSNNEYYSSDEYGVLFNKERTELIQYPTGNTRTSYTIPSSVTTIRDYAFSSCDSLKNVTIINGVTFIGECAFSFCYNLESVLISDSVTSIGYQAFYDCDSLTSISVDGNNKRYSSDEYGVLFNKEKTELIQYPTGSTRISYTIPDGVITIGDYSFYDCDSLASIKIGDTTTTFGYMAFYDCDSLTSITLPNSATSIGAYAFAYCNSLTSITILDNITYVGFCAFYYCGNLTNVYYSGTEEQWNKISIDSNNWCLTSATIHYDSTGPDDENEPGENIIPEIKIGADRFSFGEEINGFVGTTVNVLLVYTSLNDNVASLNYESSNTDVVEIGTIQIGSDRYITEDNESSAEVQLILKSVGNAIITITSPDGVGTNITVNVTKNIYNIGEETYSFQNFGDEDSEGGHCFGMSMTSSAYHIGEMDIRTLVGTTGANLYQLELTSNVKAPICYYQGIQGNFALSATVAGGTYYRTEAYDIVSDWNEVVNYVSNNEFNNEGSLQLSFRKEGQGGHAVNFLRYEEVNGEERIYIYDSNFPNTETYLYMTSAGQVLQAPNSTFNGTIDCVCLRDVSEYFSVVGNFNPIQYIFAHRGTIAIDGVKAIPIDGDVNVGERVVFEIPANTEKVTIIPLVDNASFTYLNEEYFFGKGEEGVVGELVLPSDGSGTTTLPEFTVTEEKINTPEEPEYNYTFSIQEPSRTEIRNKDGIVLHANVEGTAPNGSYVRWESSNGNFDKSADGSNLKIIAKNKGYTTFTAILCDADGNELARDTVDMYSKSGFFDKIGGFFRSLFGSTKIYDN